MSGTGAKPTGPDPRGPYGVVLRRTWEREDWRALSFHARALFVYLRTCPAGGLLGVFRFHPDDAVEDLGIPRDAVEPALAELAAHGWIRREGRWVWIIDSFATTPGMSLSNPNHVAAVRKALALVPKGLAYEWAQAEGLSPIPNPIADPIADPIGDPIGHAMDDPKVDAFADHGDGDNVPIEGKAGDTGTLEASDPERAAIQEEGRSAAERRESGPKAHASAPAAFVPRQVHVVSPRPAPAPVSEAAGCTATRGCRYHPDGPSPTCAWRAS